MQEFLVRMSLRIDPGTDAEAVEALRVAEAQRAAELGAAGAIARLWRIPGTRSNAGIWRADDAGALHDAIASLPMFAWLDVEVTPLAPHPNDPNPQRIP